MKYKITIEQKATFNHEMVIDIPDNMDIDDVLDEAQENSESIEDISYKLEYIGGKVIEVIEDYSGNPDELEITECDKYEDYED